MANENQRANENQKARTLLVTLVVFFLKQERKSAKEVNGINCIVSDEQEMPFLVIVSVFSRRIIHCNKLRFSKQTLVIRMSIAC